MNTMNVKQYTIILIDKRRMTVQKALIFDFYVQVSLLDQNYKTEENNNSKEFTTHDFED